MTDQPQLPAATVAVMLEPYVVQLVQTTVIFIGGGRPPRIWPKAKRSARSLKR